MSIQRLAAFAALAAMSGPVLIDPSEDFRSIVKAPTKKQASPVKKAARKRQKQARAITRRHS
jgi:hypothetical protein